MADDRSKLIQDVKNHLADHEGEIVYWGEKVVIARSPEGATRQSHQNSNEIATARQKTPDLAMTSKTSSNKTFALASLHKDTIGDCQRCPLGKSRIKLVFGVGNPEARVMFVGEGPGFDEDRKGEPFVGRAGQLLDKILASIDLDRTKAYIANVVKCHPMVDATNNEKRGNDRPPTPEEMAECLPFLRQQISIIRPQIVVTLGATAMKGLLGDIGGISAARGKLFDLLLDDGTKIPVLPTYHPAALLRNPEWKKPVWEDMKKLRDILSA